MCIRYAVKTTAVELETVDGIPNIVSVKQGRYAFCGKVGYSNAVCRRCAWKIVSAAAADKIPVTVIAPQKLVTEQTFWRKGQFDKLV